MSTLPMSITRASKLYHRLGEGRDLSSSRNRDLVLTTANVVDVWSLNSGDIIDGRSLRKKGGWLADGAPVRAGRVDPLGLVDHHVWARGIVLPNDDILATIAIHFLIESRGGWIDRLRPRPGARIDP